MKRLAAWWLALTSARERGTTLACFRIAVACVIAYSLLSVVGAGLVDVVWVGQAHGGLGPASDAHWLLELLGGRTPAAVWTLVGLSLLGSAMMALGAGGRWPILATLLAYRAVSSAGFHGSYDLVILNAAWLLFLSDSTATLSLDCRRKNGSWSSEREVPAWPRYLVVFQLVVIYTFTGFQKLSPSWTPLHGYSALYWFLQDPTWIRHDTSWVAHVYPLTQVLTAATWHFETSAPLLLLVYYYRSTREHPGRLRALFNRFDWRLPFTLFGLGLHLGILLLMNMGPFSYATMAYYVCLWRPEELEAAARRVRKRLAEAARAPQVLGSAGQPEAEKHGAPAARRERALLSIQA